MKDNKVKQNNNEEYQNECNEEHEKQPAYKGAELFSAIVLFILHILLYCIFLFGGCTIFNTSATLFSTVNIIFDMGALNAITSRAVLSILLSILYLVLLIIATIYLIRDIKRFILFLKVRNKDEKRNELGFVYSYTIGTFFLEVLFIVSSFFCSGDNISGSSITIIIFGMIAYLTACATLPIRHLYNEEQKFNIKQYLFHICKSILVAICVFCLFALFTSASISDLLFGFTLVSNGIYNTSAGAWGWICGFFTNAISPILSFIASIIMLKLLYCIMYDYPTRKSFNGLEEAVPHKVFLTLLYFLIVYALLYAVLGTGQLGFGVEFSMSTLGSMFTLLREKFISTLIVVIAGVLITLRFSEIKIKPQVDKEAALSTTK